MRLLQRNRAGQFSLTEDLSGDGIPKYAILSHTWGVDTEEVTFEDITNSIGEDKPGYEKIRFCEEQARQDGLFYFWVDTCCINKRNDAELSRSINSMFRWYRNATRCYVYLSDVSSPPVDANNECNLRPWELDFRESRWFARGWTLQELLAPALVEFFSRERKRLGDKSSLSFQERSRWIQHRQTKLEEDKAYSLLGIFDVHIFLIYGEGAASALARLKDEFDKMQKCIQELYLTDPCDDKKRIEETKGGLLEDSYHWILKNADFQQWYGAQQSRLLWIKGDPGKGKTMLLCGIINKLERSMAKSDLLSYFFYQATDSRINNATAMLRGLIYMLANQQPSLVSYLRKKYDQRGKTLFEDANAWVALSEIFTSLLQDPSLNTTYLIIDALDECVADLPKLLDFIVWTSSRSPCVKWIISSRNWPEIGERLEKAGQKVTLWLELNPKSISAAVSTYIQYKANHLAQQNNYKPEIRQIVFNHLSLHANDTFLWVALVCQDLENVKERNVKKKLAAYPLGLDPLYKKMIEKTWNSDDADYCKQVLAIITLVYRPITLKELTSLIEMPDISISELKEIVLLCGSFLTLREHTISFVHQSAKDFLIKEVYNEIYPFGIEAIHHNIFSRSLQAMSQTLRRDIYSLRAPGISVDQVEAPNPDPLAAARYSCLYWVDHLLDCGTRENMINNFKGSGLVSKFLRKSYLYWLEALSLMKGLSDGILMVRKLESWLQADKSTDIYIFVLDAVRFVLYNRVVIEQAPLQLYCSALIFAPEKSIIRAAFEKHIPAWIQIRPKVQAYWSAALQTLEGHSGSVTSVAFSPDGKQVVSGSDDKTVRLWDTATGAPLQTLEGHSGQVSPMTFSPDSKVVNTPLLVSNEWIVEKDVEILWLPPDYRSPICRTVWNENLVLGYQSGRLSFLGFQDGLKVL